MTLTHEPSQARLGFQLAYGDTDTVGIAYFAIYYRWMERCYSTWLYSHGIRSGQMAEDLGAVTVGISSGCRYVDTVEVFDEVVETATVWLNPPPARLFICRRPLVGDDDDDDPAV